jgi:hypothetical protein
MKGCSIMFLVSKAITKVHLKKKPFLWEVIALFLLAAWFSPGWSQSDLLNIIDSEVGNDAFEIRLIKSPGFAKDFSAGKTNTFRVYSDFTMDYIWLFNEDGYQQYSNLDTNYISLELPQGIYTLVTGMYNSENERSDMIQDSIDLNQNHPVALQLSQEEIDKTITFTFLKPNFQSIVINTFALLLYNESIEYGLLLIHLKANSPEFIFNYNGKMDVFWKEWAIKGKQISNDGDLYLLNNKIDTINIGQTISNDPANLCYADFQYEFPDSVETDWRGIQVLSLLYGFHFWINDIYYYFPFRHRVYQDTSAYIGLQSSKFIQSINATGTYGNDIYTSELRIGANEVKAYTTSADYLDPINVTYPEPIIISRTNSVKIGYNPTFFYGYFKNERDSIIVRANFGRIPRTQLFLSQTNDALRHYPLNYQLYQQDNLIAQNELFLQNGYIHLMVGYDPADLMFSVQPGQYRFRIFDSKNEINGQPGISSATAIFDLQQSDRDPPRVLSYQILSDDEISNTLNPTQTNKIRIRAEDNHAITSAKLYYSTLVDTNFIEIMLENSGNDYLAELPELPTGFYSLRTVFKDSVDNQLELNMEPAFFVNAVSDITERITDTTPEMSIRMYPNPFNSVLNMSINVADMAPKNIEIEIFSILGQSIYKKIIKNAEIGSYNFYWKGVDNFNRSVASGIYLIHIKGGDSYFVKKIVYLK